MGLKNQRRDKICMFNCQKQVLHALHVLFLIPCISFKFSANLRREMTISLIFTENVNTQAQI